MLERLLAKKINEEMNGLSHMLFTPGDDPSPLSEYFNNVVPDYSLSSLVSIEDYLQKVEPQLDQREKYVRVVLRVGAYLGEVIRRNSARPLNWYDFKQALKLNKGIAQYGQSLETKAVLLGDSGLTFFPLNKVAKFLQNGSQDSIHYFAGVAIDEMAADLPST